MLRLRIIGCMILFLVVLVGCQTDAKQAGVIYQKTEKAASYESDFSKDQQTLNETKDKEQEIYTDILNLDVTNTEKLNEKADKAMNYIEKQQELITKAQEQFDHSYDVLKTIKENTNGIDDKEKRDKVEEMGDLMNKRKTLIDAYFEDYQKKLDLHDSFYAKFEEEDMDADELDEQIDTMNKQQQNLEKLIEQFNQTTDQYNQAKGDYYQLVDLTEKDIKKADGV